MSRFLRQAVGLFAASCIAACNESGREDRETKSTEARGAQGPRMTKAARDPRQPKRATAADALKRTLARAESLPDAPARDKAIAAFIWEIIETDPDLARAALTRMTENSMAKIPLIQHIAMRMADADPDAALAWAATLESEREAAAARVRIALVMADADPARAAHLLSEHGLANREFGVAVVQVLRHWADKSPPDAAAWVALFPEGDFRREGIRAVVSNWTQDHPQAAFSWLAEQAAGAIRAEAADVIAEQFLAQPREIRETWLQYADPMLRDKLTRAERDSSR